MSDWRESAHVLRSVAEITDTAARLASAAGAIARDHVDCESVLDQLASARAHLANAVIALHAHAATFEALAEAQA
jgi:hypothetical protein